MARTRIRRFVRLATLLATSLLGGACTVVKPVVGLVTGPMTILRFSRGACRDWQSEDGRVAIGLLLIPLLGAGAGLATGVVSDVHAVCGHAKDPCRNWWDPFATNTMASTW